MASNFNFKANNVRNLIYILKPEMAAILHSKTGNGMLQAGNNPFSFTVGDKLILNIVIIGKNKKRNDLLSYFILIAGAMKVCAFLRIF